MRRRSQFLVAVALATGASSALAQSPGGAPAADDDVEIPSAPVGSKPPPLAKPPAEATSPGQATPPAEAIPPSEGARPGSAAPSSVDQAARERQARTDARLEALAARVDAALASRAAPPPAAPPPPARPFAEVTSEADPRGDGGDAGVVLLPRPGFLLSGYAQGQYFGSRASQDQIQQGGALLNQDQFVVRRARLRADRRWRYAALVIEIDGNTTAGSAFGLRRAEASLLWDRNGTAVPPLLLTLGMFYVPFGYELPAGARTRAFMERSLSSTAMFPGQAEVGVRLAGAWRFLRYAVAIVNGEPVTESSSRPYRGDPNAAKDLVGRLGVDVAPASALRIAGGVSLLQGQGFHPGTDATKSGTVWVDANEDGRIDLGEVTPVPATAATPSANFRRWAVGADLRLALQTRFGLTQLSGEVVLGSNLDRGLFGADPIGSGLDVRQLGFYAAVVQDIFAWGLVGFRFDVYDPRLDAFDTRAGQILPNSQRITTLSPLVGARIGERSRLSVQYDRILDKLGRDAVGVPADLRNDQLTIRLQVDL